VLSKVEQQLTRIVQMNSPLPVPQSKYSLTGDLGVKQPGSAVTPIGLHHRQPV